MKIWVLVVLLSAGPEAYDTDFYKFYTKGACEHARDSLEGLAKFGIEPFCVEDMEGLFTE